MILVQRLSDLPDLSATTHWLYDSETSGLSPYHGDRIAGIAVSPWSSDGEAPEYYVPIRHRLHDDGCENLPVENVLRWIGDAARDPKKTLIGHGLKYDVNMLRADGILTEAKVIDSLPYAHVVKGDRLNYELDRLTKIYVPDFKHTYLEQLESWFAQNQPSKKTSVGKTGRNYSLAPIELMGNYACEDLQATRLVLRELKKQELWGKIPNFGLPSFSAAELLVHEMELVLTLADMEWNGAQLGEMHCLQLRDKANEEIEQLFDELYKLAGRSFHVMSWKEMWLAFESAGGVVLFWTKPEFDEQGRRRGKQKDQQFTTDRSKSTGRPCWNSVAIMRYLEFFRRAGNTKAFEFVRIYREASQRQRLVSTNLDVYLQKRDAAGRIHGQFHQHRVVTGRLSSTDPNEENVAVVKGNADLKALEKVLGAKDDNALSRQLRKLFVAERGHMIVSLDLSQIEYRAAAFMANDLVLLNKYRNDPKTDYHQATSDIIGCDRDLSKTLNFLSLYGGGPTALAAKLTASGIPTTVEGAKQILNRMFQARPSLRAFLDRMSESARKGYVQNCFGRRCPIPQGMEYIACNYVVQGSCGDLLRRALTRFRREIKEHKWPIKMFLPVHDEIVFQVPTELVAELVPELVKIMCYCPWFGVPILSDAEVGSNWGEVIPFSEWVETRKAA
ncbi:MAG: hypothetical protein GZ088_09605 [Acidipila sp.]|nr:hypothetical protein [Acidipila sp.]